MAQKQLIVAAVVIALAGALGGAAALATPGSGILSAPVLARGAFVDPVDVKFKLGAGPNDILHVQNAQDTVVQQIVIAPGGTTGWHSHPGPVIVVMAAGTMSFYSSEDPSCTATTYSAGQAFIDEGQGHVHFARNEGTENVVLMATYLDVPPGQGFRIDAANLGTCGF